MQLFPSSLLIQILCFSPLSVGPIPVPADPLQEERAQETFEKLYRKIENNEENENLPVTELTGGTSEIFKSSETRSETKKRELTTSEVSIVPISLVDKVDTAPAEDNFVQNTFEQTEYKELTDTKVEGISKSINLDRTTQILPPLEDPSVILLSSSQVERSDNVEKFHHQEEEIQTLADEVKHIKEDKAAEFLKEELKDKIVDLIAYEKHNNVNEEVKVGQGTSANHFLELRQKQMEAQRDFHKKLLCELEKDPEETKNSAVAEALGTKFQVKTSKSSHQIRDQFEHEQGSLSVPSKSPEGSRKGSFSETYMSKGAFWSHSLPRRGRRVTFTDEQQESQASFPPPPPPSRPPPPAPVRQQSIHAMKDLSTFSTTYNNTLNTLQEKNQQIIPPEPEETRGAEESPRSKMTNLQSVELRSYNKARDLSGNTEADYKVDMGPQRDPWVEVYGKSVLNNTLHDRLEKHSLQKSQSAVWNNNQVIEHQPVLSTDKLEKPKKVNIPQQDVTRDNCSTTSSTLPRASFARTFPSANNSLRRNTSMTNLNGEAPSSQSSSEAGSFQVPPTVVRGIVITVLQNQGIINPDEEILQRAIEEYYSKNPAGVSGVELYIVLSLGIYLMDSAECADDSGQLASSRSYLSSLKIHQIEKCLQETGSSDMDNDNKV